MELRIEERVRKRTLHGLLPGLLLLLLATVVSACDDDGDDVDVPILDVRVTDEGLEPDTVNVRVPDRLTLNVENATDTACLFHLGPWIRLDVAPNTEASMDFWIATEVDGERTEMGCEDRALVGTVEVAEVTNPPLTD